MSIVEKLLLKIFSHYDIIKPFDGQNALYLRRWFVTNGRISRALVRTLGWLVGKTWEKAYLHKIVRSDDDRDPHDHPWNFDSLILKTGYWDESWDWGWADNVVQGGEPAFWRSKEVNGVAPGRWYHRNAEHTHRVQLVLGPAGHEIPAWTLVFVSPKVKDWGFVTDNGWVWWRNYLNDWSEKVID